jgi:hypothetical protein
VKKQVRKIIALQANAMRESLKKVDPFGQTIWNTAIASWENKNILRVLDVVAGFNQVRLARLYRGIQAQKIHPAGSTLEDLLGVTHHDKCFIIASVEYEHYCKVLNMSKIGEIYSDKSITCLSFFHKNELNQL